MRCPRKWNWSYIQGLRPVERSENLDLGTAVHRVLQEHYRGGDWSVAYDSILTEEQAMEFPHFDLKLFEAMCEGYFEWLAETGSDAYLTPVMIEEQLEMDLGVIRGRHVTLHGTIDLVHANPDGQFFLMDHKTTASFEALANRRMQLSFQLQTYSLLLEHHWGQPASGAIYNMLRKVKRTGSAKPPFFMREMVAFNKYQRASFKTQLLAVVDSLLRAEDESINYAVVDQDCTWKCPFLSICAMQDDGSDIEGALNDLYVRRT